MEGEEGEVGSRWVPVCCSCGPRPCVGAVASLAVSVAWEMHEGAGSWEGTQLAP